jgi:DTW domain-containing protein YfiP
LCDVLIPVHSKSIFDILQHPSEVNVAKNTAKLCALSMPNTKLWVGESKEDFEFLRKELEGYDGHICVLYPSEEAVDISKFYSNRNSEANLEKPFRFLVLDGTWRKAYKLWKLNSWLQELINVQFRGVESNYHIRKSPKEGGLSTLESVVHCLNCVEPNVDTEPLMKVFHKRQSFFKH